MFYPATFTQFNFEIRGSVHGFGGEEVVFQTKRGRNKRVIARFWDIVHRPGVLIGLGWFSLVLTLLGDIAHYIYFQC